MKEILQELKKKYLSFDKTKSKKNFTLNHNKLILSNLNDNDTKIRPYQTISSINNYNSKDFSTSNRNSKNLCTIERYTSMDKNNFFSNKKTYYNFGEIYNKSLKRIYKKRIRNKLPNLMSISNSTNSIIQKIRRHVLFTQDNYPYSLNDNEYGYKTLKSKEKKDILKENKCILEQIDNEEYMSKIKCMFNEELMNKENISFTEKIHFKNICNMLIKKIHFNKLEHNSSMIKEFYVKRDYKIYLAGKLSINSVQIRIVNTQNGLSKSIPLPFIIIPFYLSLPRNIFYFFISKILSVSNNGKELKIDDCNIIADTKKFEKFFRLISFNHSLFDSNSILFDEKKLEKEIFYLFKDDNTFSLTIIPPYIELSKNEEKIKITKIISKGLWLALFQDNFKDWELMCLTYLYCFQAFRQIQYSTIKFHSNKTIILDIDDKFSKNTYNPTIKEIDKKISFFICNKDNNFLFMILFFYSLDQIYVNHQYKLFLTLEQTKILLNLNKENNNLLYVLYKCSLENEQHKGINFNFSLIKAIQQAKINNYFTKNHSHDKKYNSKKMNNSYKYYYKKGLNIKLNLPMIEIYDIKMSTITKKDYEIKEDLLSKMNEIGLIEFLKDIGKFVVNKYNSDISETKNKNINTIVRANTSNDIQMLLLKNNFRSKNGSIFNNNNQKDEILLRKNLFNKNS